jgi:hypothetical protein
VHSRIDAVEAAPRRGPARTVRAAGLTVAGIIRIVGWPLILTAFRLVDEESPD